MSISSYMFNEMVWATEQKPLEVQNYNYTQ